MKNCNSGITLVLQFIKRIFPEVDKQLAQWHCLCKGAEDPALTNQALASIRQKRFHAQGGSIYALYPGVDKQNAIQFIVSFQTVSDYLDNLCDRAGIYNEYAFRQLHQSMLDAVDLEEKKTDYYKFYPYKNDNHYLKSLVDACRSQIAKLPTYPVVIDTMKKYIQWYSDLQTYKHLSRNIREKRLEHWALKHLDKKSGLFWWEFSAATGSTLGIFMLYAAAHNPNLTPEEVKMIDATYFPWIHGLHILLDYYIDAQEDMQMGDLNFTYYYRNLKQCEERIVFFIDESLKRCNQLPFPEFHITVIKGLLAMYLSDPKASQGLNKLTSYNIIKYGSSGTQFYHHLCKLLRLTGTL